MEKKPRGGGSLSGPVRPAWASSRLLPISFADHVIGKRLVRGRPGDRDVRSPLWTEAVLQGPQQRDTDRTVIIRPDPIGDVAFGQRARGWEDVVKSGQPIDHDPKGRHQLAPLLGQIAAEQRLQMWGDFE